MIVTLIVLSILTGVFYKYLTWNFDHWKKLKIPGPTPSIIVGNLPSALSQNRHKYYDIDEIYRYVCVKF